MDEWSPQFSLLYPAPIKLHRAALHIRLRRPPPTILFNPLTTLPQPPKIALLQPPLEVQISLF